MHAAHIDSFIQGEATTLPAHSRKHLDPEHQEQLFRHTPPVKFHAEHPQQLIEEAGQLSHVLKAVMAAWAFLFSNYAIKDWVVFAEAYGQPLRIGKYDSSATAEDIDTLLMALRQLGTDAAAVIPKNMEIDFVDAGNKAASVDIYDRLAAYFDKQISKVVLGQTLSTNTGDGGGGAYALGKVHNEVRQDILESDVIELESTLSRDYVRPLVDLNLGPQAAYPKIRLRINKPEDLTALAGVVDTLVRAGLPVDANGQLAPAAEAELLAVLGRYFEEPDN